MGYFAERPFLKKQNKKKTKVSIGCWECQPLIFDTFTENTIRLLLAKKHLMA
jgi:hypothetical protein